MEVYRPYSTFAEESFQAQQSFMVAHFQIINSTFFEEGMSHCGILLKQLIESVMTKYWISWLSGNKTHMKNKAKTAEHKQN